MILSLTGHDRLRCIATNYSIQVGVNFLIDLVSSGIVPSSPSPLPPTPLSRK
ncbi:hypothetical protein GW17_00057384, partial [Ensete ventricosum]